MQGRALLTIRAFKGNNNKYMCAKVSDLKKSISDKEKAGEELARKLFEDAKRDELEEERMADLAGLQIDENPVRDEHGHAVDKYIGTKEAWNRYALLQNGEWAICSKCSSLVKRGDGEVSTIC